jgi:hypothetical protein
MITITQIIEQMEDSEVDISDLTPMQLQSYRNQLKRLEGMCGAKMAETSTKDHYYDDEDVCKYIDTILNRGFNLETTALGDFPNFIDAQRLRRWTTMIAERVAASEFSAKKFRVHSLRLLRSNIAASKNLHDLRQAVNLMISPLELWRDHLATCDKYSEKNQKAETAEQTKYVDAILKRLEKSESLCKESKRVLDEIMGYYDEGMGDISLLRNCENAKKSQGLSDEQAASLFGINRKALQRLRKNIVLVTIEDVSYEEPSKAYWDDMAIAQKKTKEAFYKKKGMATTFAVGQVWLLQGHNVGTLMEVNELDNPSTVVYKDSFGVLVKCNETGESLDGISPSLLAIFPKHLNTNY